MSNVDPEETTVLVEGDGIEIEKTFEPDDFPVPAIAFAITSDRDEPVLVRLVDEVPHDIPAEDIGFHPKYGAEYWSVDGDTIVFEREFDAGEEYTTVYGLRARDTNRIERFLGEPELDDVEPTQEDASQAIRDVIGEIDLSNDSEDATGELDAQTSSDDLESAVASVDSGPDFDTTVSSGDVGMDVDRAVSSVTEESGSEAEGTGGPDLNAETSPGAGVDTTEGDGDAAGTEPVPGASAVEDVASVLAAEIREGRVSDRDLQAIRQALDVEQSGSDVARIDRLQRDVSDLQAYTDALEAFLDEEGDAQTLLRDLQSDIDGIEDRLQTVDSRTDTAIDRAENADERVAGVEDSLVSVTADMNRLDDRVGSIESEYEVLEEELSALRADADSTDDRVDRIENNVERLEDTLGDVDAETDAVDERLDSVEEDLEGVRSVEARIEDLEDRLEGAHEDLEELSEMREQLSSVFAAGQSANREMDESDSGN